METAKPFAYAMGFVLATLQLINSQLPIDTANLSLK